VIPMGAKKKGLFLETSRKKHVYLGIPYEIAVLEHNTS